MFRSPRRCCVHCGASTHASVSVGLYEEAEVLRAKQATMLAKPTDVRGYFRSQFRTRVPQQKQPPRPAPVPIRTAPDDDPYGF